MMAQAVDIRWARKKLERARNHLAELERAATGWLDPVAHPLEVALSDDGCKIEAILRFRQLPPLEEWSLLVGDCVHNLRTALDVFVWANSTLLPEGDRRKVAYPILARADDEDEDDEPRPHRIENQPRNIRDSVQPKVQGLPEPLRSRVVGNMRWASFRYQGDLVWHQRLPLIRELDDIDKHRLALELETTRNMATWAVRAKDAEGRPVKVDVHWSLGREIPTLALAGERVVIATGAPERRVASIAGTASVALGLRVRLFDLSLDVRHSLGGFLDDVEGLLDVLSTEEE